MNIEQLLKREQDFFPDMNVESYWNFCKKYHLVSGVPYSVLPIEKKGRLIGNILYRMYKFKDENGVLYFVANTEVTDPDVRQYAFGYCDGANRQIAERLIQSGRDKLKSSAYAMSLYKDNYKIEDHIVIEGDGFFAGSLLLIFTKDVLMALKNTGYIHARF